MSCCPVLSEPLPISNDKDIQSLYVQYKKCIAEGLIFRNKPVAVFIELTDNLWQQTFDHLVTKDNVIEFGVKKSFRLYDYSRASKILWIRDILIGSGCLDCTDYRVFPESVTRRGRTRFAVWCVKADYVIVLEERTDTVMLITAYELEYENAKRKLEKKYNDYLQKTNPGA